MRSLVVKAQTEGKNSQFRHFFYYVEEQTKKDIQNNMFLSCSFNSTCLKYNVQPLYIIVP